MNVLFLADPNSIHDIKWMSWLSGKHTCFLISRKEHLINWGKFEKDAFYNKFKVEIIEATEDFSVRRFRRTLKQWNKIKAIIKEKKIDVFHIMFAEPNALWAFFKSSFVTCKWVLTTRGTDVLKTIPNHFAKKDLLNKVIARLYRKALNNFDLITSTSITQVKQIKTFSAPKRVELVRTGVDILEITQEEGALPYKLLNQSYLLFPRNMRPLYNHQFSLAAIKLLTNEILEKYKFVFIDKDSNDQEYVAQIEALMAEIGKDKFVFLPRQSQKEIYALYKHAEIIVMNPKSDGSPVSAMEALVCGRPLILGNLDYDNDIFGDICFKLTSWDPTELANFMEKIIRKKVTFNPDAAINRIIQKANREVEMNRLNQMYGELCFQVKAY